MENSKTTNNTAESKKPWKTPVLKRDSIQSETHSGLPLGLVENSFYTDS